MKRLTSFSSKLFSSVCLSLIVHSTTVHAGVDIEEPQDCNWQCLADVETRQWRWMGPNGRGSVGGCNTGYVCRPNGGVPAPSGPCTEQDYRTPVFGSCQPTLAAYQVQCEAAGVPSPPPLGSPPWANLGNATGLITNIGDGNSTTGTLYSWTAPNGGTCLALQRQSQTGVICSNRDGSRACFYNFQGSNPIGAPIATYQNPLQTSDMENCAACHNGPKPFLVTESVADELNGTRIPRPTTPYAAVAAPPSWTTISASKNNFCQNCHKMPEPNLRWCINVAIPAIVTSYMPPEPKTEQQLQDAASLMLQCCELIKKAKERLPPECGGGTNTGISGLIPNTDSANSAVAIDVAPMQPAASEAPTELWDASRVSSVP